MVKEMVAVPDVPTDLLRVSCLLFTQLVHIAAKVASEAVNGCWFISTLVKAEDASEAGVKEYVALTPEAKAALVESVLEYPLSSDDSAQHVVTQSE